MIYSSSQFDNIYLQQSRLLKRLERFIKNKLLKKYKEKIRQYEKEKKKHEKNKSKEEKLLKKKKSK